MIATEWWPRIRDSLKMSPPSTRNRLGKVNGKQGWDSGSNYLPSGLIGAGTGLAMSGVGLLGSKFLPAGQRTLASGYAERYRRMTTLLEEAR